VEEGDKMRPQSGQRHLPRFLTSTDGESEVIMGTHEAQSTVTHRRTHTGRHNRSRKPHSSFLNEYLRCHQINYVLITGGGDGDDGRKGKEREWEKEGSSSRDGAHRVKVVQELQSQRCGFCDRNTECPAR